MSSSNDIKKVLSDEEISMRTSDARAALHHYRARIENLWHRSPQLRALYENTSCSDFLEYIDTEAILYYRELQECGVKLPAWKDMITVGGETDLRIFLEIGRGCFRDMFKYLESKGQKLRMLDFGVGCGRTARHFFQHLEQYEMHGCDVDQAPIEYLYKQVPSIQPLCSPNSPPLPYEANYFDAIYSVSVFSHLNEKAFLEWTKELSRIIRPGGLLVISIHGEHALNVTKGKDNIGDMGIDESQFYLAKSEFETEGFMWLPQKTSSSDIDVGQYGISFVNRKFIDRVICPTLRLVHYGSGEVGGWQDLVVLSKS